MIFKIKHKRKIREIFSSMVPDMLFLVKKATSKREIFILYSRKLFNLQPCSLFTHFYCYHCILKKKKKDLFLILETSFSLFVKDVLSIQHEQNPILLVLQFVALEYLSNTSVWEPTQSHFLSRLNFTRFWTANLYDAAKLSPQTLEIKSLSGIRENLIHSTAGLANTSDLKLENIFI